MEESFEDAVHRHQRHIHTYARYLLGGAEEAADVTQEVLLKLWHHRREVEDERAIAWLTRVTRNACYDYLRGLRSAGQPVDEERLLQVASPDPGPESRAAAAGFRDRLVDALGTLDEPYKSIVILREIRGLRYREIAEALELPLNTVRVYLHRARRRLRVELKGVMENVVAG